MAQIGDDFSKLLDALIPGGNWSNGHGKGIDNKRRVEKATDQIKASDINELRDAFYNFATIASAGISTKQPEVAFKTNIDLNQLITLPNWCIQSGIVRTQNRENYDLAPGTYEGLAYQGEPDWNHSFYKGLPPQGYNMSHLKILTASFGAIYFRGQVNIDDSTYIGFNKRANDYIVICNNSSNRNDSLVNILAVWSKPQWP